VFLKEAKMIRHVLLIQLLILSLVPLKALGAGAPAEVQGKMTQAIAVESSAQAKADDWGSRKADQINEIRDLQTRLAWLQYQKKKHEIYVQGVKDTIADLEARKLVARQLRENIEPYLEDVVTRLEAFVKKDLPFLPEERQQRLSFLRNTLNDYQLDLGEKLRRVYEALGVEATYGKMVTATDETLPIDGKDTAVTIFRLGRMAMFYQSPGGEKIGQWNTQSGKWEPLPKEYAKVIRQGLEMARRERTVQLIQLPLGAVTQ
jgi:hypothetical protein